MRAALPLLLLAPGCRVPEVCPASASDGAIEAGDVNGDGEVDLSDAAALRRNALFGGRAPACEAAADLVTLGVPDASGRTVDLADAAAILHNRFSDSSAFPTLEDGACASATTWSEGSCGGLRLGLDAPRKSKERRFEARVQLESPDLRVEGWSLSVRAEGCAVVDLSLDGTAGADRLDAPPGYRKSGFTALDLTADGGAVAAVLLGFLADQRAPAGEDALDLLVLTVEGEAGEGCSPCRLWLEDGGVGRGAPVPNVITVDGRSHHAALPEAKIRVCPD